jgi:hypothetical protein
MKTTLRSNASDGALIKVPSRLIIRVYAHFDVTVLRKLSSIQHRRQSVPYTNHI